MVQGIIIIAVFLFFAVLMYRQKIPSFLALLLMAIIIPLVAGAPLSGDDSILGIVNAGSYKLASSIPALLFGAWVGEIMNQSGITKDIIRRASELAGDKPLVVGIVMYVVVALLFTTLTGLGAHIMVAMLVLPILTAVGIKPIAASCLLIMARATGLVFNMSQWTIYMSATGLEVDPIKNFAIIVCCCGMVVGLLFVVYQLKIKKATAWAAPVKTVGLEEEKKVPLISLLTPLIPFPLVIGLKWAIIPALVVAAFYGAITTSWRNLFPMLSKTIHEAFKVSAPALVLYLMIGMILSAMQNPHVSEKLLAFIGPILPSGRIGFIVFFMLLAPMCLYRGPLNLWGMGAGVLGLLVSAGSMPTMAIVAGFLAVQLIQLSSDPTNTHNVWTADYFGMEVNSLTRVMLPTMWIACAAAVIIGSFIYY
ncbi:MAG: C4-dicarboxylate ABC transporter [Candidatus Faecousia sp.]|nr:C4-dicarboxylate ABC transporter [Clostridiales bacterium]MDY6179297.1 C4-dicarboxylate ABC transporter [Candidatus Faecousia sp.]